MMQPRATIDRYTLIARLGDPSMGEVWKAQDLSGKIVAIKTISSVHAKDRQFRERFSHEAQRHMRLHHPNIVPMHAFFERDDRFFIVMDFIPGGSLADRLEGLPRPRQMDIGEGVFLSQQVLTALNFIHENMLIHRDVKPSNVLLHGRHAFLADFGIAIEIGGRRITMAKRSVGTTEYMSPEQITSPERITHLSDVYSYGCVLYEMLAGRPPFIASAIDSDAVYVIQQMHVKQEPEPIRKFNPRVPERLERILQIALAKRPQDRFPGCGAFAQAISSYNNPVVSARWQTPGSQPPVSDSRSQPPGSGGAGKSYPVPWRTMLCSFAGLGLLPLLGTMPSRAAYPVLQWAQLISAGATWLVAIYRSWKTLDDGDSPLQAREAALLMLVPLFSLYWGYRAIAQFPQAYNQFLRRHDSPLPPLEDNPYMAIYVAWLVVAVATLGFAPMFALQVFAIIPLSTWMFSTADRRLRMAPRQRALFPMNPQPGERVS